MTLYDLATGDAVGAYLPDADFAVRVATSPDGRRFAIDADDVTWLARLVLTRGFTLQECARYFRDEPSPTMGA